MRAILSKVWRDEISTEKAIQEILGNSYESLKQTEDGQNKIGNLAQAFQWWKEKVITVGELEEIIDTELERLK